MMDYVARFLVSFAVTIAMGAVVWVIVAGPLCWGAIYYVLNWLRGM